MIISMQHMISMGSDQVLIGNSWKLPRKSWKTWNFIATYELPPCICCETIYADRYARTFCKNGLPCNLLQELIGNSWKLPRKSWKTWNFIATYELPPCICCETIYADRYARTFCKNGLPCNLLREGGGQNRHPPSAR